VCVYVNRYALLYICACMCAHMHARLCSCVFCVYAFRVDYNNRSSMAMLKCRVGQNRIYTYIYTVYLVISKPKIPYVHRIYMVLANPTEV